MFARDETKVTFDVTGLGITGFQAADWLYEHRRIGAELHDMHHVMFLVTIGDDEHAVDELVDGMRALADAAPELGGGRDIPSLPPVERLVGEYLTPPREAFLGTTKRVKLEDAPGEIAAEPVSPYPPGVPVLVRASASGPSTSTSFRRGSGPACSWRASASRRWRSCG